MTDKILLTGGNGFIGHTIVSKLDKMSQYTPIVLDNQTTYNGTFNCIDLEYLHHERRKQYKSTTQCYNDNIAYNIVIDGIVRHEKPDIIIHLASLPRANVVRKNPQLGSEIIIKGLLNLLEASVKNNVKRFVFISSSMVYGNFEQEINPETASKVPIDPYGIMKLCAENLVRNYNRLYGLEYSIVRPSAVYGPRDVVDRVLSKFIMQSKANEGMQVHGNNLLLDFTYVTDAADGIIQCATHPNATNETFNITRGHARSLVDAGNIINDILGSKSPISIIEQNIKYPTRGTLDINKAKTLLNYNPTIDIEQGLRQYIDTL